MMKRFALVLAATVTSMIALGASAQTYDIAQRGISIPVTPNQQFRADIMNPAAGAFDVGAGVLANVYQTDPGDPLVSGYATVTFDLGAFAGQTVRLRFAEVDNQGNFNAGVDAVAVLDSAGGTPTGAVTNGGFETNGGAGTSVLNNWTIVDQPGGSGSWFAQTGTVSPINAFAVPAPPEGNFGAMTDQTGPGSHVLYQDITVPAGGGVLSFELYLGTFASDFFVPSPATLDFAPQTPPAAPIPSLTGYGLIVMILAIALALVLVRRNGQRMAG